MGITSGELPACYLVSGLAARRGDAGEKLLERNREVFKLKMSKETEEVRRWQLGVFQLG